MTTINLKRYYPYMTENVMLEVSDEIAATLSMGGRLCDSYKRQKRRNGECSLDTDPGFEADVAGRLDFAALDALPALTETRYLRHVRLPQPLRLCVDGRRSRAFAALG